MATLEDVEIFVASPGDLQAEREIISTVVADLNRSVGRAKRLVLTVVRWERDTFPSFGVDPQEIVNQQIAEMSRYALFIGVMWNRVGSPTPRSRSGTIEEFGRAEQSNKQFGKPGIWF